MAESSSKPGAVKDPRTIARKYQLELCKRAMEENIIVYLGTGCGKTHIAVLLMYELGHLIRKPSSSVCVFLAPTVPLVRQQAMVIENSTEFKVGTYFGRQKQLKSHGDWDKEMEQFEVLVMTPQILLHNLHHCFIRMECIALLIFDECHHAQAHKRHPYAQIMKEFYKTSTAKCPRIFGMTASPIIGKGGSNQLEYTKCINSLENLLDAKVCSVDGNLELESVAASPDIRIYFYGPVVNTSSTFIIMCIRELEEFANQYICMIREQTDDMKDCQKKMKHLWKIHESLVFCLENIGLWGGIHAVKILLSSDRFDLMGMDSDNSNSSTYISDHYLKRADSVLNAKLLPEDIEFDSNAWEALEEPFFSKKMIVLIGILSSYRLNPDMKCIIFVKRVIVARSLAYILGSLKSLDFWKCEFLVGCHSGLRNMSRKKMYAIVEKFSSGQVNLLVATNVAEEGLDIQTCCLVVRFDLPPTVASFIQSRGRARMLKSEYIFLLERGNERDEKLLKDFMSGEDIMNKEIISRTTNDTFNDLEEKIYKVYSTGASISTGCTISLLHHYCNKLPRDIYFTPSPKYFYMENMNGTVCRIVLPPNSPLCRIDSPPCTSKDEAKRVACLEACIKLHERGALSDYLLPGLANGKKKGLPYTSECCNNEVPDESLREELHELLVPSALRVQWNCSESHVLMHFYYIKFIPIPEDRLYRMFGLFVKARFPEEAEAMEVDLHLTHGRIVKTSFVPSGTITFSTEEIILAEYFQEMCLKIILDRPEYFTDCVCLGKNIASQNSSSTCYLLLPLKQCTYGNTSVIDWTTVRRCLSSPAFGHQVKSDGEALLPTSDTLELLNGPFSKADVFGGLVFTPHNKVFFFIDGMLDGVNASSPHESRKDMSHAEHYRERFNIELKQPEQPFLKAKQLFVLRNLLHNRIQESTEAREVEEHFVPLPPELCLLKIIGFSKDIGSSLSLLPSLMHRLEKLLVAIELKEVLSASFQEASEVSAYCILEALTTEKCLERLSLERLEVLGDAFLKYAVGRHSFLSFDGLDEGQLTRKRSSIVNNLNLYELAIRKGLQVYIHDELFEPSQFFALGRPCMVVCGKDDESGLHCPRVKDTNREGWKSHNVRCSKSHRWLHRKTIADVVEALIGAFLVESGFRAAIAFLHWIGIEVDFAVSDVYRVCKESEINMSLFEIINVPALEELLGYKFQHRGLLLQALVHPSYHKHSGGCYQKLEFLGDAVLEYLITSYLYSAYPNLKPGHLTDLRSITVNNNSFAHLSVQQSLHLYLIEDSKSLTKAVKEFKNFVQLSDSERDLLEEPICPKVLGDIVESSLGAILLDSGFNLKLVWETMLKLLDPVLKFSSFHINPVRELRELCQNQDFELGLPDPVEDKGGFFVKVEVKMNDELLTFSASNNNSRAARRMAAQAALLKLKALGYKHKGKSLEEIIRSTQKKEAQLIGYDEEPLVIDLTIYAENLELRRKEAEPMVIDYSDSIHVENLDLPDSIESPSRAVTEKVRVPSSVGNNIQSEQLTPSRSREGAYADNGKVHRDQNGSAIELRIPQSRNINHDYIEITGGSCNKSAKSKLYEICAANYWKRPSFVCCKEEGPSHQRTFTSMVIVEVDTRSPTILECVSEAKAQKRAAEEHAAEGALWYLNHLGCLPKQ